MQITCLDVFDELHVIISMGIPIRIPLYLIEQEKEAPESIIDSGAMQMV